jgi:hypothetical protein
MLTLRDRNGKSIGYVHHHAILHPDSFLVTGLILGHYVYSIRGVAKGKYFKSLLYNVNGEIVATAGAAKLPDHLDISMIIYQSWQILAKIDHYEFPWVNPKKQWSGQNLQTMLM